MGKKQKTIRNELKLPAILNFVVLPFSLLLYLYTISRGVTLPYVGYNAWNFNIYSLIAHNYLVFGFLPTKFAPIISVSQTLPSQPSYYLHHPQLLSLLQTISFSFFKESFWSGRFPVILCTTGSLVFLYLIAKKLWGKNEGILSVIIASLLPGFILFGRMIGQEALVLFFVLYTMYWILCFIHTPQKKYLLLLSSGIILGVLSDWPMIYFIVALFPYFIQQKKLKLALYCLFLVVSVALLFLLYIYLIMGNFSDLSQAFFVRSISHLTQLSFWPIRWATAIIIRVLFYFSPLVSVSVLIAVVVGVKKEGKKFIEKNILLFSLFLFGVIHIALYPEGSFGHPYWIIYLLPCIVLSFSRIISIGPARKSYILLGIIFIFSLLYLLKVESWKTKEIQANLWRIDIARVLGNYVYPYTTIAMNPDSPVDYDTLLYQYKLDVHVLTPAQALAQKNRISPYFFICPGMCQSNQLGLLEPYYSKNLTAGSAQVHIFNFQHKKEVGSSINTSGKQDNKTREVSSGHESLSKRIYITVLSFTQMPQL